jgi:hypothetical protein
MLVKMEPVTSGSRVSRTFVEHRVYYQYMYLSMNITSSNIYSHFHKGAGPQDDNVLFIYDSWRRCK